MKPQPISVFYGLPVEGYDKFKEDFITSKPRYKKGEKIYIKEQYCLGCDFIEHEYAKEWKRNNKILYKYAGDEISVLSKDSISFGKWKNPLFMPEKYARYFIESRKSSRNFRQKL